MSDHQKVLEAAVRAIDRIMIGGNHLASALIHLLGASENTFPPYGTPYEKSRDIIGDPIKYDLWVAWNSIMLSRDAEAALRTLLATGGWTKREWLMREAISKAYHCDTFSQAMDALRPIIAGDEFVRPEGLECPKTDHTSEAVAEALGEIERLKLERDAYAEIAAMRKTRLDEYLQEGLYTDESQTTWTRPTAYAYAMVCKARDKWQALAESYRTAGADLDALDAAHAASTQGYWGQHDKDIYGRPDGAITTCIGEFDSSVDAESSAALHNAYPALSRELRAARKQIAELEGLTRRRDGAPAVHHVNVPEGEIGENSRGECD